MSTGLCRRIPIIRCKYDIIVALDDLNFSGVAESLAIAIISGILPLLRCECLENMMLLTETKAQISLPPASVENGACLSLLCIKFCICYC